MFAGGGGGVNAVWRSRRFGSSLGSRWSRWMLEEEEGLEEGLVAVGIGMTVAVMYCSPVPVITTVDIAKNFTFNSSNSNLNSNSNSITTSIPELKAFVPHELIFVLLSLLFS